MITNDWFVLFFIFWSNTLANIYLPSSANRGDSLDKEIETESSQTNDFIILVCWIFDNFTQTSFGGE